MASIVEKRGKWQAQVRRRGFPSVIRTFATKAEAERFGRQVESAMDSGTYVNGAMAEATTVADLLDRYMRDVSPKKRSHASDISRARALRLHLGPYKLTALSIPVLVAYRDSRANVIAAQTLRHELGLLDSTLTLATREWGIVIPGGVPKVIKPRAPAGRDRRVRDDEIAAILAATRSAVLRDFIPFAIETAMRRSEIVLLAWEHIDLEKRTAHLPRTKTDVPRTVPLSRAAAAILARLEASGHEKPFERHAVSISESFCRAVRTARGRYEKECATHRTPPDPRWLTDLRLHDLRHEATSRLFERGLNVMEVAAITGHRSLKMLQRYTHLRAEDLAKKLD